MPLRALRDLRVRALYIIKRKKTRMKNSTTRLHLLYLLTAPIVALLTAALRTVALLTEYEPAIGRYASSALSFSVAGILVAVGLTLLILTHELRELFVAVPDYRDLPSLFAGIFAAIALAFFAVTFPIGMAEQTGFVLVLSILAAVLSLAGGAFFVYRAFHGEAEGGIPAMLALPLTLLCVPLTLALSFTTTLRIDDPAVTLATVALVSVAFFFLGEARIALGRAKWALHTCMTAMTAIMTATCALPDLIYYTVREDALLDTIALDFVMLALFLYAMARLAVTYAAAKREGRDATRVAMGTYEAATAEQVAPATVSEQNEPTTTATEESTDEEDTDR